MKRVVKLSLLAICSSVAVTAVIAQNAPQTPEQEAQAAVDTRQGLQKVMGFEFVGPLGGMLKGKVPYDAAVVAKNAANVAALASMQPDIFSFDTRKFNLKTKAREGIWTNKADFDARSNDMVKAANEAVMVAKSGGDKDALKKAIMGMGKGCAGCHDNFRDK